MCQIDSACTSALSETEEEKPRCLIIIIANETDSDMTKDAHTIIFNAQRTRQYVVHSLLFEPYEIRLMLQRNTLHQTFLRQLHINADYDLKSYFDKVIILGHCHYYTINYDTYYNDPYISHEPTSICDRTICGLDISPFCNVIQYLITQLQIYHISLCCCESATKNVHLECESLDEITEEQQHIYKTVARYRLNKDISTDPQFANEDDEDDKHLFAAFTYGAQYAMLVNNMMKKQNKRNIKCVCDQSLSVLDLISNTLYEQKVLQTLKRNLIINALNGFGYYRHQEMNETFLYKLQCKLMDIYCSNQCHQKDNNLKAIYSLDKQFVSGPLRIDCIYYSIKDRNGVQWLIDKDDNNLHKNKNWCVFELTQILEVDCLHEIDTICNDKDVIISYNEQYFVHRPHVIQYQFNAKEKWNHLYNKKKRKKQQKI